MELGDIGLGFVMLTIGLGSASLAALYWQVGGLTLLSFGLFAFLYGIQALLSSPSVAALVELPSAALLHVVSTAYYWLPVPGLIFLEQILGPGAWPLFRRLWQGWCVLALACLAHDLAVGPAASTFVYQNVFVVALVLSSLLGVVYFFRVFEVAYLKAPEAGQGTPPRQELPLHMLAPILVLMAAVLVFGLLNQQVVGGIIRHALPGALAP